MKENFSQYHYVIEHALITILLIFLFALAHYFIKKAIRHSKIEWVSAHRRKLIRNSRNTFFTLGFVCVIFTWADLGPALLSVSAIFVATVLTLKELLVCLNGCFWRFRTDAFEIGDRIEVAGTRGTVQDIGYLSTKLLSVDNQESAPRSAGKIIYVPNSLYLTNSVYNLSALSEIDMCSISIAMPRDADIARARTILQNIVDKQSSPYADDIEKKSVRLSMELDSDIQKIGPSVSLKMPLHTECILIGCFLAPHEERQKHESQIMFDFHTSYYGKKSEVVDGK